MTKKSLIICGKRKNRMGFANFITDHQKMDDRYEEILKIDDNSFIDQMDHWALAVTNELGVRKELEIIKLKKKNKKLEKKIKKLELNSSNAKV